MLGLRSGACAVGRWNRHILRSVELRRWRDMSLTCASAFVTAFKQIGTPYSTCTHQATRQRSRAPVCCWFVHSFLSGFQLPGWLSDAQIRLQEMARNWTGSFYKFLDVATAPHRWTTVNDTSATTGSWRTRNTDETVPWDPLWGCVSQSQDKERDGLQGREMLSSCFYLQSQTSCVQSLLMNTLSPGVTAGAETYMWHQVFRSQSTQEFAYISWIAELSQQNTLAWCIFCKHWTKRYIWVCLCSCCPQSSLNQC